MIDSIETTDNNCGKSLSELSGYEKIDEEVSRKDLLKIGNKKFKYLLNDYKTENLLVFSNTEKKDDLNEQEIFSLYDDKLTTYNMMGFIGINDTQLTISSRFDNNKKNFFLHYMLQKVFSLNVVNLKNMQDSQPIYDFLIYLFPFYLKKAVNQGIFKEYRRNEYNNPNVKGSIDIARHIRLNNPFQGNIAYKMREHTYDNRITQLIRHTIEYIRTHKFGSGVLEADSETYSAVNQMVSATSSYSKNDRQKIIIQNNKTLHHPYYTEYEVLRKICLRILKRDGLSYGKEKDKIYGLLFDGSWLWEEYLNTILKNKNYKHPKNKESTGAIYPFKDNYSNPRYPDFYNETLSVVLDAKYKRLENKNYDKIDRNDLNQIITYMYIKKFSIGGFIYPLKCKGEIESSDLNGYEGKILKIPFEIPETTEIFESYKENMRDNEKKFIECIKCIEKNDFISCRSQTSCNIKLDL